jgi:hypothetical protein
VILAGMAAIGYGFAAFRWGFSRYPLASFFALILLVLAVLAAGATLPRIFPDCGWSYRNRCAQYPPNRLLMKNGH